MNQEPTKPVMVTTTPAKLLGGSHRLLEEFVDALREIDDGENDHGGVPLTGWDSMALNTMRGRALAACDILEAIAGGWRGKHLMSRPVEMAERGIPTADSISVVHAEIVEGDEQ